VTDRRFVDMPITGPARGSGSGSGLGYRGAARRPTLEEIAAMHRSVPT
jgi:hypothetical protein